MNYYSIGEFAKLNGKTKQTLRDTMNQEANRAFIFFYKVLATVLWP